MPPPLSACTPPELPISRLGLAPSQESHDIFRCLLSSTDAPVDVTRPPDGISSRGGHRWSEAHSTSEVLHLTEQLSRLAEKLLGHWQSEPCTSF